MSDYVTLLGAEQVQSAGYAMRSAAETISSAASTIHDAMWQHSQKMQELIDELRMQREGT